MRVVVQRVTKASVTIAGSADAHAAIESGLLILLGVGVEDSKEDAVYLAQKVANLRIFEDVGGKLNLSLVEQGGAALVVSNFTVYGDCRKGRRPSFTQAASGQPAEDLYRRFGAELTAVGIAVQYGVFGADMQVALVNDGPVTVLLDSKKLF